MTTVKRVKHIDVISQTKEAAEIAVLAVAEQGVSEAVLKVPVDKGKLKQSLNSGKTGKYTAVFGSPSEYAPYQEFGTYKMKAQPYLRPAADNLKKSGSRIFAKILKGVLNHG